MERITTAERRARVGARHHVSPEHRVSSAVDAARGMVCLHATDPASVYLSAWARLAEPSFDVVDHALYEQRQLLRMLAMRRTMFVVPTDEAPVLHAAASLGVASVERRRNEELAGMLGVDDPAAWMRAAEEAALEELEARGEATAQELSRAVPALGRKIRVNIGKRYEGDIGVSSRALIVLALEGRAVRARPRGTWLSSQYRWTTMERWLGRPLPVLDSADAQARLVERWLARFGPGTEADLRWWSGLTARAIRAALSSAKAEEVALEGSDRVGYVLPGDLEPTPELAPWVALLPALDPTTMGWQARDWYLGDHRSRLFDTAGNAGPTIWVDGRIVGGWAIRDGGEVVTGLLEDVGREAKRAVEAEAARLGTFMSTVLGNSKVLPRFPTPYFRELLRVR